MLLIFVIYLTKSKMKKTLPINETFDMSKTGTKGFSDEISIWIWISLAFFPPLKYKQMRRF